MMVELNKIFLLYMAPCIWRLETVQKQVVQISMRIAF